jgi:hypothetical protein
MRNTEDKIGMKMRRLQKMAGMESDQQGPYM